MKPSLTKAPTSVYVSHNETVQYRYGVDDGSDIEYESVSDTENQDLLEIINDIKLTLNYSLELRKKFREKIKGMEEYEQDEWKKILKSYAQLETKVKDENDELDSVDAEDEENDEEEEDEEGGDEEEENDRKDEQEKKDDDSIKENFWDFIKEFKHVLNEKDLKMVEKYLDKAA